MNSASRPDPTAFTATAGDPPPPSMRHAGRRVALALGAAALLVAASVAWAAPSSAQAGDNDRRPSGLAVELVGGLVTLSWDAPAADAGSVTGYKIVRRLPLHDAVGAFETVAQDTGDTATSWVDTEATTAGEAYAYRVVALRGDQESKRSRFARIDLPADYTPPQPEPHNSDPVESDSDPGDSDPEKSGGPDESDSDPGDSDPEKSGGPDESDSDPDESDSGPDESDSDPDDSDPDESTGSDGSDAGEDDAGVVPQRPSGLVVELVNHLEVYLGWGRSSDDSISGYEILRRTASDPPGQFATINADTRSAAPEYHDTDVEPATTYIYRVKALNAAGKSRQSRAVRTSTWPAPAPASDAGDGGISLDDGTGEDGGDGDAAMLVPAAPTGLRAPLLSSDRVVLVWDDPGDESVSGYAIVRLAPSMRQMSVLSEDTASTATSYTDDTAQPGTRYLYAVHSLNEHGASAASEFVDVTTLEAVRALAADTQQISTRADGGVEVWSATMTVGKDLPQIRGDGLDENGQLTNRRDMTMHGYDELDAWENIANRQAFGMLPHRQI